METGRPDHFNASLVLAGAGKMGSALLRAWIERGYDPRQINVVEPHPSPEILELCRRNGLALGLPSNPPQTLVLAMKPQILDEAAAALAPFADQSTLIISILAGKTIANLGSKLPGARAIIRAMPNLPASVGRGITALAANAEATPAQRNYAEALLGAAGRVEWLANEQYIDAVTAVSGSGPAYVFYLAEALAAAGEGLGLPGEMAARLARAAVEGAGELLYQSQGST
ncbi:MAG: NAD(P)-binding domain-containing protein, partial [Beijerinckiaceae bacterium]|nr:NAD(P)-binding domain-containing protein [Beijerinckiaceae bacterium]